MSAPEVGYAVDVVDDVAPVAAPTATDTVFLLHTGDAGEPALQKLTSPAQARSVYTTTTAIHKHTDALFAGGEGAATVWVAKLDANDVSASVAQFTSQLGPGQLVAPEVVTAIPMTTLGNWAFANNRIAILNGPDGSTTNALTTLANAVKAGTGGRFASLEADTMIIPGVGGGSTREVPGSIVRAAMIARNDILTGNPNLAAAGRDYGTVRYALGIKAEHTDAARQTLAAAQVNTFRNVWGSSLRGYGYLTLADLTALGSQWWDLNGSRTVMAARALEAAVAEDHMFGQIDGEGKFLDRYVGALRGALSDLQAKGALYGSATSPGYSVNAGPQINSISDLAAGKVTAQIKLRTSPHARSIQVNIIRRRIDQEV